MEKPHCTACDKNRDPILSVIRPLLSDCSAVLEIGSGTGQHAVYFAERLPHLVWYTSDRQENHAAIAAWLDDAATANVRRPLQLDVTQEHWPVVEKVQVVFSANTAHIMSWSEVQEFFAGVGRLLPAGGKFMLYGPFNYNREYTSQSNAEFDAWLKQRDPGSGIRDFEELNRLALDSGLLLVTDYSMPANNRLLYWQKRG